MSKDEVISYLFNKGISSDYNKPMNLQEIKRKGESWQRQVYNNIIATNNLVNIQQVKGSDLEIVDTDKYDYLMTYSFPCQDLSVAGKGKGMADTSTRSGMLWEVERILDECYKLGSLPQILLMENVTQVVGTKNIKHFQKWRKKLEDLGYQSYVQNMIATEYGIPQARDRAFMLSVLGEYNYTFPNKMPLKYRLKNLLENDVDESYYLTSKQIKDVQKWKSQRNPFKTLGKEICPTLITRSGAYAASMVLTTDGDVSQEKKIKKILIPEATKKGCAEAYEGGCDCLGVVQGLRIRKLTPRECFRLMGVKDEDFENIAKNQSNSGLYHLAGDSIVTTVLMAILGKLLGIDYESKINELLEELANKNEN